MKYFLLILFLCGQAVFYNIVSAEHSPPDDIEIVIEGKRYKSMREYKRQKIKNILTETFSSSSFQEFSREELYEIIQEILNLPESGETPRSNLKPRDQSSADPLKDPSSVKDDTRDLITDQMQDALVEYHKEHQGGGNLRIKPNKLKNIIIEAQKEQNEQKQE